MLTLIYMIRLIYRKWFIFNQTKQTLGTQFQSLGWEDSLEKEMATHSSTLAWEIPWTEEPCRLQSIGSQRVRHNLATKQQQAITGASQVAQW